MTGWRHDTFGHEIDRSAPVTFTFDGQKVQGFEGDTLASALLASGQRVLGRSFKYHRPRGLWGMAADEPNAVFDVKHEGTHWPNARATLTLAQAGMDVRSVNAKPSARNDRFGLLDLAHRFLPAGFYYKTFMALHWNVYEPFIRRMAGLGRVDQGFAPPADVMQVAAECDVLVVGAGPAGLTAASTAARAGKRVWLVEDAAHLGGSLRWRGGDIDGAAWQDFVISARHDVENAGGRVLTQTTVWGAFDHGMYSAWERGSPETHWRIRAAETILATGGIERPVWFANNDLPGVMSAEAALYYLRCHGVVPGKRIVLATANDQSYAVAQAMTEAGAEVTVVDARPDAPDDQGVRQRKNATVQAAGGGPAVTHAVVNGEKIACDAILCSGGVTPTVHLWCQSGGKLRWDAERDMLVPRDPSRTVQVVGAANGTLPLADVLREAHDAGGAHGAAPHAAASSVAMRPIRPDPTLDGRQWIDLQNDVTLKDVGLAAREGFTSVEHLKRYTTLGMATDQGRTSNFAGLAAMSELTGKSIPDTGTTTYRPPFQPVPLRAIAGPYRGALYHAPKRLVLEGAHRSAGAQFREYGGWLRPSVYGNGAEAALAQQEARIARETVAIYDASPLGKLEVIGPGVPALLDFTGYVRMSTLKPGRARYGFMLSETGVVYDDGVVLRLAEDRFIVSASSSHVDGVRFMLEDARQDRIGRSSVFIHDVTQSLVTLTVTGPKARALLKSANIPVPDIPHMGVAETDMDGVPLRVARISFTGDASFELSVPVPYADTLRERLDKALSTLSGRWIGLEAVMILRAEKGFILIGKDTDGSTMPHDLGWGGPREKRSDEYLGKRSLFTAEANRDGRKQLVGLRVPEGGTPIETGSHIIPRSGPRRSLGFVTSSYVSPTLERPFALALLEDGRARMGQTVRLFNDGLARDATVTEPCAFDPKGERLHG